MKRTHFALLITLTFFLSSPFLSLAKEPEKELAQIKQDLSKSKLSQENLSEKKKQIAKELSTLQSTLADHAQTIQKYENESLSLKDHISQLNFEMASLRKHFKRKQENASNLILAVQRLARIPPQSLILRPSAPIDIARSELLMTSALPVLKEQITSLKDDLKKMATLQITLKNRQKEIASVQTALQDKRALLSLKLAKRKQLMSSTEKNYKKQEQKIARLTKKSKNLQALLNELAKETPPAPTSKPLWKKIPFLNSGTTGSFRMPIAGRVTSPYSAKNNKPGWTISSASNALVTAPEAGRVKFAGPFRGYKLLVIIEHSNGLLSLIGNMDEVYIQTGYQLQVGEPIGKLGGDLQDQVSLYYELRKNGQAIDPAKYIKRG